MTDKKRVLSDDKATLLSMPAPPTRAQFELLAQLANYTTPVRTPILHTALGEREWRYQRVYSTLLTCAYNGWVNSQLRPRWEITPTGRVAIGLPAKRVPVVPPSAQRDDGLPRGQQLRD
jgi:hypothetical protein